MVNRDFFPHFDRLAVYIISYLYFFKIHILLNIIDIFKNTFVMKEKYDNMI